jgi:hypothetical protein
MNDDTTVNSTAYVLQVNGATRAFETGKDEVTQRSGKP